MQQTSDTYQRILDSARDLIYASSYAEVGVAAICEKAEVKKGSFYHFFPSKQALTLAVIDGVFADFKHTVLDLLETIDLPPLKKIERLFEAVIEQQIHIHSQTGQIYGCPFGNLATEMATQDELIRNKLEHVFNRFTRFIKDTLQQAVAAQDLEPLDVDATADAMLACFEGMLLLAKTRNDPVLLNQLAPAVIAIRIPTQS